MSYVKQNFVDGQTLSASQLNHIENGLAELENTLGRFTLQEKTVTPSTELQEVTPDEGYYGLSKVVVEAVESGGSGGGGDLFDSSASGRIPDYDHGYADSTVVLSGLLTSTAS